MGSIYSYYYPTTETKKPIQETSSSTITIMRKGYKPLIISNFDALIIELKQKLQERSKKIKN